MSTNRDTTQTYNAGAYDPNTLANYQAASKNSLDSQNTAKGVFNGFMTDPWSAGGFGSILSASAGKTAMDYQPGMNALAQRASLWGTNPGFLDNSNAILAGSYGGAQQQNLANLKGQAATLQMNAANNAGSALAPKFNPLMGGKTTESYSGLGTWLPQIAAAGLGTLGGYFNKQANANTTPGGVTINGGVVPPVGSTNTTGQGGTTTGTTPNSFLDPSISNFFQQYLGISPNTAAGSANTLQGIQNALLQYGAGQRLLGSPFSSNMFGSNDPSAGGEAALANALLPLLFGGGGSGGSGGGSPITINNNNNNSNTNTNNLSQWMQQWMNANGVTGSQTGGQTKPPGDTTPTPTPQPPPFHSTWDPLPIPRGPQDLLPTTGGVNPPAPPGDLSGLLIGPNQLANGMNFNFGGTGKESSIAGPDGNILFKGTYTPNAPGSGEEGGRIVGPDGQWYNPTTGTGTYIPGGSIESAFGGGNGWNWDQSKTRQDNGHGVFFDGTKVYKESNGQQIPLQYDPNYHVYVGPGNKLYDGIDAHPLSSSEWSMIYNGGNAWQGSLPPGGGGFQGGNYDGTGNPVYQEPGSNSGPRIGPPAPILIPRTSSSTQTPGITAQPGPTSNVNNYLNSLLAPGGSSNVNDYLNSLGRANGNGTSNVNDYLNALGSNPGMQLNSFLRQPTTNIAAGQGRPVNTAGLNATNPLLGATSQGGYTPDIGHPAQGQPIVFQQGSSGGGTNAGFNPGTMFNAAIPWQSVTLSNGQQAVVNPLNNQSYDMSGAPLSNLWSS